MARGKKADSSGAEDGKRVKREDCKLFLQDEVAEVLPAVMKRAKDKVLGGDLTTFKKLWDMSGLDKQDAPQRKKRGGLGSLLLKKVMRESGEAVEAKKPARPRTASGKFARRVDTEERGI